MTTNANYKKIFCVNNGNVKNGMKLNKPIDRKSRRVRIRIKTRY